MTEKKEAFVSKEDRPDPKINLDRPVAELTIRDLVEILHVGQHPFIPKTHKDRLNELADLHFADRTFSAGELTKAAEYTKISEVHKSLIVDYVKSLQDVKSKDKDKFERDHFQAGPVPLEGLAQLVTGLTEKVGQLADQVSQLAAREQKK
jgi:hypothetical protein